MLTHKQVVSEQVFSEIIDGKRRFHTFRSPVMPGDVIRFERHPYEPEREETERKIDFVVTPEEMGVNQVVYVAVFDGAVTGSGAQGGLSDLQRTIQSLWASVKYSSSYMARADPQRDAASALLELAESVGSISHDLSILEREGYHRSDEKKAADAIADVVICAARIASTWPSTSWPFKPIDLQLAVSNRLSQKFSYRSAISSVSDRFKSIVEEVWSERTTLWGKSDVDHPLVRPRGPDQLSFYGLDEEGEAMDRKISEFDKGRDDWMLILVAEVSRFGSAAVRGDVERARKYAVRIAAVAMAIVDSIDKYA
jgi:hypothetical protein